MKPNETTALLEARRVCYAYTPDKETISDISFSLEQGDIFTILGPNGAGKSTLLNCLGQQLIPTSGEILIDGKNIQTITANELAKQLGYVAQVQNLAFDFTIRDYLVLGRAPHIGRLKTPGYHEYQIVDQVLEKMQLTHLAEKSILQISGGERQQAQIARVLVQRPKIILMDEPTNHLDYGNQLKILKMIVELSEQERMAVILTTHMPDHAILLGGKVGIVDQKGHMRTGTAEEIVTEENLSNIYRAKLHMIYIEELHRTACIAGGIR